jgi:hypothetical protein
LINEDTRSQGRKSLELLSIARDDHGLGKKKKSSVDDDDDDEIEKSAGNNDVKSKRRVMLNGINGEKISKREKRKEKIRLLELERSNDKSDTGSKKEISDASDITETWVRCLVVVRKVDARKGGISTVNIQESSDPRSLIKQREVDVACYTSNLKGERKTMSCLPNIFKCFSDEQTEETSPDNFIFPGFRKRLFDATWKGGMECGF